MLRAQSFSLKGETPMSATDTTPRTVVPDGTWQADPRHSHAGFEVRHMMIATVRGSFGAVEATLEGGSQPRLKGTIDVASVDTGDTERDAHLRSPDFFDTERHPQATFASTGADHGSITGDLTIKGVTREVTFDAEFTGAGTDPWGNDRIAVDLRAVIDRRDYGIVWNQPLPTGGVLVDERVTLVASLSLVRAG
jgi:polyisoprenoid-binding protein YceI